MITENIREMYRVADQLLKNRDVREDSKRAYMNAFKPFFLFLKNYGLVKTTYIDFKNYVNNEYPLYSISRKKMFLTCAKMFLIELKQRGVGEYVMTENVSNFKDSRLHKKEGLTKFEVQLITNEIKKMKNSGRKYRLKAMFYLLRYHGLRQIELRRLNFEDINFAEKKAFIQGKGMDDKEAIHLDNKAIAALKKHIEFNGITSGAIFKGFGNRNMERLSGQQIMRELKWLFQNADVKKTPHGLRHFFTTYLLDSGMDVREVRQETRHRSLDMIITYDDERKAKERSQQRSKILNF